jgi:hypothetical protein
VPQYVEGRPEIPQGRQNVRDVFSDTPQFAIETFRVLHLHDGVGAKDALEPPIAEGPMVNVIDPKKK